jgi:membrane-bound hydrogenase subunit beta
VERTAFKEAVEHLCEIHPNPHFSVASGFDIGNQIELIYHFTVNYAGRLEETTVSMRVRLPKRDPVLPTITDLIPGALISERELQEMLGVRIDGIPDSRRMFLHEDFPKGVYPWRRDEKGPAKLVRNLHEGGK